MWPFEMCLVSLFLWQFNVRSVTALTRCALGLQVPGERTDNHPTLAAGPWAATPWPWLGLPQPEPRFSKGWPAQPCHLVFACQKAAAHGFVLASLRQLRAASPCSCLNPTAAVALGCGGTTKPEWEQAGQLAETGWKATMWTILHAWAHLLGVPLLHAFPAQELINTTDICSIITGTSLRTQQMNGMVQSYCLRLSTNTK